MAFPLIGTLIGGALGNDKQQPPPTAGGSSPDILGLLVQNSRKKLLWDLIQGNLGSGRGSSLTTALMDQSTQFGNPPTQQNSGFGFEIPGY